MASERMFAELSEGMSLPVIQRTITQEKINRYAEASHDYNPIHINEEFARKSQAGGTIAHGMLILAYISQMMTSAFGQNWLCSGKLGVRFRNPARPGDVVTVNGKISKIEGFEGGKLFTCEVLCTNQNSEVIINGDAKVRCENV